MIARSNSVNPDPDAEAANNVVNHEDPTTLRGIVLVIAAVLVSTFLHLLPTRLIKKDHKHTILISLQIAAISVLIPLKIIRGNQNMLEHSKQTIQSFLQKLKETTIWNFLTRLTNQHPVL